MGYHHRAMTSTAARAPTPVAWRPYIALAIGLATVSAGSSLVRLAQNDGAPSLGIAAWRLTIAALILTPLAWTRHRAELRQVTRTHLLLAVGAGAFLAIHF